LGSGFYNDAAPTALRLAPAANRTNGWTKHFRRFKVEFMKQVSRNISTGCLVSHNQAHEIHASISAFEFVPDCMWSPSEAGRAFG